jgi:ABC-type branched-subunit amino acid transport system substrate-binding protein
VHRPDQENVMSQDPPLVFDTSSTGGLGPWGRPRSYRSRWIAGGCAVLLVLAAGGAGLAEWTQARRHTTLRAAQIEAAAFCGGEGSHLKRIANQCIGANDDSNFVFNEKFRHVTSLIHTENRLAETRSAAVTIGLFNPWSPDSTSQLDENELLAQLEGYYTAQHYLNRQSSAERTGVRLVLVNQGGHQKQWSEAVESLKPMLRRQRAPLVAVAGMGMSVEETELAATAISHLELPMVGVITTADQLNSDRIPDFFRVLPSSRQYVLSLGDYLRDHPELDSAWLLADTGADKGDLFTASMRDNFEAVLKKKIKNKLFFTGSINAGDQRANDFKQVNGSLCSQEPPDVVLFAGRQVDLKDFLRELALRPCLTVPIKIMVGGTDLNALREQEKELDRDKITLIYAASTDVSSWQSADPGTPMGFKRFTDRFTQHGFPLEHLNDGSQAMAAYDAVRAIGAAIDSPTLRKMTDTPTSAEIAVALRNIDSGRAIDGATGTFSFARDEANPGNPIGKQIPVLQIPADPKSTHTRHYESK